MPRPRQTLAPQTPVWLERSASIAWRVLVLCALGAVVGYVLARLRIVVLPLLFSVFLAAILYPFFAWLERRGLPRWAAALVAHVVLVLLLLGAAALLIFGIASESRQIATAVAEGASRVAEALERAQIPGWDEGLKERVTSSLMSSIEGIMGSAAGFLSGSVQVGVAVFMSFFILRDGRRIRSCGQRLPAEHRRVLWRVGRATWVQIGHYIRGITITAAINSTLVGLAMWAIGVPLIFPIMVTVFIGSYIPYAGPFIATVLSGLIALANGGPLDAGLAVGAGLLVQFIEGNFLHPFILGHAVRLHPAIVLLSVAAGGALWGIAGGFLGIPIATAVQIVMGEVRRYRKRNRTQSASSMKAAAE